VRIEDVMIIREDHAEVITKSPKNELIVLEKCKVKSEKWSYGVRFADEL
jgi:hypothetical protein